MDEEKLGQFRQKLIEDEDYRHRFADNPGTALAELGIDLPEGAEMPSIDRDELDERISNLRTSFGPRLKTLYQRDGLKNLSLRDRVQFDVASLGRKGRGGLYKLSVAGTADW